MKIIGYKNLTTSRAGGCSSSHISVSMISAISVSFSAYLPVNMASPYEAAPSLTYLWLGGCEEPNPLCPAM